MNQRVWVVRGFVIWEMSTLWYDDSIHQIQLEISWDIHQIELEIAWVIHWLETEVAWAHCSVGRGFTSRLLARIQISLNQSLCQNWPSNLPIAFLFLCVTGCLCPQWFTVKYVHRVSTHSSNFYWNHLHQCFFMYHFTHGPGIFSSMGFSCPVVMRTGPHCHSPHKLHPW